jgi:hypothetical protein
MRDASGNDEERRVRFRFGEAKQLQLCIKRGKTRKVLEEIKRDFEMMTQAMI